ncbi:MAG: PEP-CTERM sorting domain-containing protein [Gemmatimonadota bacterium]
MRKFGAVLTLIGGLAVASASPAMADGFQSYRFCGGDTFQTCAAVQITVVGTNVTMRVWNLSQNLPGTYGQGAGSNGGSVVNGIGFFNVPAGVQVVTSSLGVTGPVRPGDNGATAAAGWSLKNFGSVAFAVDYRAATSGNGGIASGCATAAQLPGTPPNFYMNPCNTAFGNTANWVTFNFQITGGAWDPSQSAISFRAFDGITQERTECWTDTSPGGRPATCVTVTPEPVTMTLLATGLAGMGGAGFFRRRKNKNQIV